MFLVSEKMNENEVIRVIRLKTGMMKLTEACLTLYHKCNIILYAQKDIITEISDRSTILQILRF